MHTYRLTHAWVTRRFGIYTRGRLIIPPEGGIQYVYDVLGLTLFGYDNNIHFISYFRHLAG